MTRNSIPTKYGEVTFKGMEDLLNSFKNEIKKDAVFLDIGSGYGKIVTYMAEIGDMKSIGLELLKERHDIAKKILWSSKRDKIKLVHGDVRDNIDLLKTADVVFSNCILFDLPTVEFIMENRKPESIFIQNKGRTFFGYWRDWETIEVHTSWKRKGGTSKFYKINTNTNR